MQKSDCLAGFQEPKMRFQGGHIAILSSSFTKYNTPRHSLGMARPAYSIFSTWCGGKTDTSAKTYSARIPTVFIFHVLYLQNIQYYKVTDQVESAGFTTQGVSQAIPHHSAFVQSKKGGNLKQTDSDYIRLYMVDSL